MTGLDLTKKTLRRFGLLFAALFCLLAATWAWKGRPLWPWPALAALGCFTAALAAPAVLRRPYRAWMLLAAVLGWFMTRLILTAAYAAVLTPTGLLMKALGKDLLDERISKQTSSYWKKHEEADGPGRYKKQF